MSSQMKVLYFVSKDVAVRSVPIDLANFEGARVLLQGDLKLPTEVYCVQFIDGDEKERGNLFFVKSVNDVRLMDNMAKKNGSDQLWLACQLADLGIPE